MRASSEGGVLFFPTQFSGTLSIWLSALCPGLSLLLGCVPGSSLLLGCGVLTLCFLTGDSSLPPKFPLKMVWAQTSEPLVSLATAG